MPSEAYGRNGVTPIFRSFHRTDSSTTGGLSRWNIFASSMVLGFVSMSVVYSVLLYVVCFLRLGVICCVVM